MRQKMSRQFELSGWRHLIENVNFTGFIRDVTSSRVLDATGRLGKRESLPGGQGYPTVNQTVRDRITQGDKGTRGKRTATLSLNPRL